MMMDHGQGGGYVRSPYLDFDPSLFTHTGEPEYVFPTDHAKKRGWGERMFSSIGYSYLSGLAIGGVWGFTEGVGSGSGSAKLRWNSILNGCTRRGPFLANSLGVVALMYGCTKTAYEKGSGVEDDLRTSLGAAVTTGVLFRSTMGKRAMLIGGLVGAVACGVYHGADQFWNSRGQSWSQSNSNWS